MTLHLSARLAWHMDGWNGRICKNPASNTYCIGPYSFPGDVISEKRNLEIEQGNGGADCSKIDWIPECIYSVNAFGQEEITGYNDPPSWYPPEAEGIRWQMPPATICTWPYEAMYSEEATTGGRYDNDKRLQLAREYFAQIEQGGSLIFYYTNYSNPFSGEDRRRYVIVGVSRVKSIGEELFFDNCSPETKERFAGGYIWARNITSLYPDEGFRLPYHLYLDQPEIIEKFLFVPENPRNFKYGTRLFPDDDALDLVERSLEIVRALEEIGDKSEDWSARKKWLQMLVDELWSNRGLYPGLTKVLNIVGFNEAIPYFKEQTLRGKEKETKDEIISFLDGDIEDMEGLSLSEKVRKKVIREWKLKEEDEKKLLREVLPRFDILPGQIERILSEKRDNSGIYASLGEIGDNPYVISESFIGENSDDVITFNKIDHGVFPSPELGGERLAELNDWRRLRGLCVEMLKREDKHTFLPAAKVVGDINRKLDYVPDWKKHVFTEKYLEVDEEELSGALTFRKDEGVEYIYLKTVFEDEREIETRIRELANLSDIELKSPVTEKHWHDFLYNAESNLAKKNPKEYGDAISGQIEVCQNIFLRPFCVVTGTAGTGKTTVIKAVIQAIEKAHGKGSPAQLLAPTGKAADRVREKTGKRASTIHSFLAERGWLNEGNFSFRRSGGRREDSFSTYIIDEASMMELGLTAALFRAINWTSVQRLILVGDSNQLPPIGRGRLFADIIDWLKENKPENIGVLETNIRQMENVLEVKGTGILDLASIYIRTSQTIEKDQETKDKAEDILKRVQEGGDVDKDLRVLYWTEPDGLADQLVSTMIKDMEEDTGLEFDADKPHVLRDAAFKGDNRNRRPDYQQILSPYRGEQFGADYLNIKIQEHFNGNMLRKVGHIDGITLFDKVIQFRNRPRSGRIYAYNRGTKNVELIEIYNGDLGFAEPHKFDGDDWWKKWGFRLKRFQVIFNRKENYLVGFGRGLSTNTKTLPNEKVEDNLELAYAVSVHKSQGSEFDRVYFIVPKHKRSLLSKELFYTGLTRASRHCTLLIEEDITPLLSMRRPEKSYLVGINSSLFDFNPIHERLLNVYEWYEEGKIHITLADFMVRSKSEVIIANMLSERDIRFVYEMPLYAPDGTFYLPDFTINYRGEEYFWEHLGLLSKEDYRKRWEKKKKWYEKYFPGKLITTEESGNLSKDAEEIIEGLFS